MVDSEEFRSYTAKLNPSYQIPSRKHLTTKLLSEKSAKIKEDLQHQLCAAQGICLTIDLWSSRQMRGFIGVSGHFILNWALKSTMIACKRFHGRHTGENINMLYEELLATYSIGHKVLSVVTDNASNMTRAFGLPGFDSAAVMVDDSDDDSDSEDFSDGDDDDFHDPESAYEQLPITHLSCFSHTLQLCIKDGFKGAGAITKVVAKASNIVSHVKHSIHASELLEHFPRLQSANATRWNSHLVMMRSVLGIPSDKLAVLNTTNLNHYERNILHDLVDILTPFETATMLIQGDKKVTASLVIPVPSSPTTN